MKFGDLTVGDKVFILYSNNTYETEIIDNITKMDDKLFFGFHTSNLMVEVDASKSIYFDEETDVVIFSEKHNLDNGLIENG